MSIEILPYHRDWPNQFQQLKAVFESTLDPAVFIEHVGSTSVPGLAAKPILDIDIIVNNKDHLHIVIPQIVALDYEFMGDMGIKDRDAFKPS